MRLFDHDFGYLVRHSSEVLDCEGLKKHQIGPSALRTTPHSEGAGVALELHSTGFPAHPKNSGPTVLETGALRFWGSGVMNLRRRVVRPLFGERRPAENNLVFEHMKTLHQDNTQLPVGP